MKEMDDASDEEIGGKNNGKTDGNKKIKEKLNFEAEASSLRDKIDDMVKSKETLMKKTLEAKMMMTDKKIDMKQSRWEAI
jgi:hypothetical protein